MKTTGVHIVLLCLLHVTAGAITETQTSWNISGHYGATAEWLDTYHFDVTLNCGSQLALQYGSFDTVDPALTNPDEIESGDLNGDGFADIAASGDGIVNWYRNNDGTGLDWTEIVIWQGSQTVHDFKIADMNSDGTQDVVIALSGKTVIWLENLDGTGTTWSEHTVISFSSPVSNVNAVNIADIDNDDTMDIVCALGEEGLRWLENLDGTAMTWQQHMIQDSVKVGTDIYPVDLDQDGYSDVLFSGFTVASGWGSINAFRNPLESGTDWEHISISTSFPAMYVHYGNINGDTYPDVFAVCYLYGGYERVSWFENPGAPVPGWSEHLIQDDFTYGNSLQSCDLNGNGLSDLLVAKGNAAVYFINTSMGAGWNYNLLSSECPSYHLRAVDINQDSTEDIVLGNRDDDQLLWANLCGYYPTGYMESTVLHVSQIPFWNSISWSASEPDGTELGIQLRTSDNFPVMGIWSDTLYEPCSLDSLLAHGEDYIQYRVILASSNPSQTPTLHDISINWEPLSGISQLDPDPGNSLSVNPNPFTDSTEIRFTIAESGGITLRLFNLAGRLIAQPAIEELQPGNHIVIWNDCEALQPGCYLLKLDTPNSTTTCTCLHLP